MAGKSRQKKFEAAGHTILRVRRQRAVNACYCSAPFPGDIVLWSRVLARDWCCP